MRDAAVPPAREMSMPKRDSFYIPRVSRGILGTRLTARTALSSEERWRNKKMARVLPSTKWWPCSIQQSSISVLMLMKRMALRTTCSAVASPLRLCGFSLKTVTRRRELGSPPSTMMKLKLRVIAAGAATVLYRTQPCRPPCSRSPRLLDVAYDPLDRSISAW